MVEKCNLPLKKKKKKEVGFIYDIIKVLNFTFIIEGFLRNVLIPLRTLRAVITL